MTTFQSRNGWSDKRKDTISKALKRSWEGGAHYRRFRASPPDEYTLRKRALWQRRGSPIITVNGYTLRHSKRRTDAYDVLKGDEVVVSGGRVVISRWIAKQLP